MAIYNGTTGKDNIVVTDGDPDVSNHFVYGYGDSDKISILAKTKDDGVTAGVDNNVIDADTGGPVGSDKILISSSSKEGYARIAGNSLVAGDGKNKIDLKAQAGKDGGSAAGIYSNTIRVGDDDDSISISGKGAVVRLMNSSIDAGDGKNKISVKSQNLEDGQAASLTANSIMADEGDDSLSIQLSGKNTGSAVTSINNNEIDLGDGKNSVKVKASDGVVLNADNSIVTGSGDDKFDINLTAKTAEYQDSVRFLNNSIYTGDGNNSVKIKLTAKSGAASSGNSIESGDGDDKLDFSIKSGTTSYSSTSSMNSLLADLGNGDNDIKIKHSSGEGIYQRFNSIVAGDEDDKIQIEAKAADDANFRNNSIDAGNGDNDVKIKQTAGAEIDHFHNSVMGGDGDDSIQIEAKASDSISLFNSSIDAGDGENDIKHKVSSGGQVMHFYNSFLGGDGNDKIQIEAKATGMVSLEQNRIDAGGGDDNDIKIKLQSKDGGTTFNNNDINLSQGDQEFDFSSKTGDGLNNVINNTFLMGPEGNVDIQQTGKGSITTTANSFIYSTSSYGDNDIAIDLKTKGDVDFIANTLQSGDVSTHFKVTAKGDTVDILANELNLNVASSGDFPDQYIEFAGNGASVKMNANVFMSSDSDSEIRLEGKAKDLFDISGNKFETTVGAGLTVRVEGSSKDELDFEENTITGGMAGDRIYLDLSAVSLSASDNEFDLGGGNDFLSLDLLGKDLGAHATDYFFNDNTFSGGTGMDTIQIATKKADVSLIGVGSDITGLDILEMSGGTLEVDVDAVDQVSENDTLFVTGKGSTVAFDLGDWNAGVAYDYAGDSFTSYTDMATGNITLNILDGVKIEDLVPFTM